jgi:pimeloyl-ACP methyl ester carboxylesterase
VNVYFISGLGADKTVFQKIKLPAPYTMRHMEWITPLSNESLRSYANRLTSQINIGSPFAVVGVSFGGMLATEIYRQLTPSKTIIISSIWSQKQLPAYLKATGKIKFHNIIPAWFFTHVNAVTLWLFGARTPDEKELLKSIFKNIDVGFMRWAFTAIGNWQSSFTEKPSGIFHIHGTKDRILPLGSMIPDVAIEGGEHLMVYSRADEINLLLEKEFLK